MKEHGSHIYGKFWFDENGLYNFQYHAGVSIDLAAAKYISEQRKILFNGKTYPILVDGRGLKYISREASHYFSSKENTILFTAGAFLVNSFLSVTFGNFYLKVFPPNCPSRLFTKREEAINWLLNYL